MTSAASGGGADERVLMSKLLKRIATAVAAAALVAGAGVASAHAQDEGSERITADTSWGQA